MKTSSFYKRKHSRNHLTALGFINSDGQNHGANKLFSRMRAHTHARTQTDTHAHTDWEGYACRNALGFSVPLEETWRHGLQRSGGRPDLQSTSRSNCCLGIADNIWEGLILHQKDWECLRGATQHCFTLCSPSFFSFLSQYSSRCRACVSHLAVNQPAQFLICLNIKSVSLFPQGCWMDYWSHQF